MKIKAYAVCNTALKSKMYLRKNLFEAYAIFEKKKDAQRYLDGVGDFIKTITMEVE